MNLNALTKLLLASVLACLVCGSPLDFKTEEETGISPKADNAIYRLSDEVEPVSYDIMITPFFFDDVQTPKRYNAFTFEGVAKINVKPKTGVTTQIKSIVLHANDLTISNYLWDNDLGIGTGSGLAYDAVTDKLTIPIDATKYLPPTGATVEIRYKGNMKDDMHGFYQSYYKEGTNKIWMGSTQFQQTEARRAFPCFDEPGFKATFKLTIQRPIDMNSASNTNKAPTSAAENIYGMSYEVDRFDETPKMSSYLLAFIVSKYERKPSPDGKFGVYSRPGAQTYTEKALNFGQQMLAKLGEYVGVDYYETMTKMDMAAIPDFSAGAMENWGLLTYRETGVLYYPEDTPTLNEQRIVAVIAHEQAHMWFGDLVTCKWWSETWLNEGFARYFQFMGTGMIETSWDLEEQFVVENLQQSMQLDSTDATHPMTNIDVNTKKQASDMFDNISYNKAASIIRMLKYYIGEAKFKETLKQYLIAHKLKAVVPSDLFTKIDEVNPGQAKVSEFWAPWTATPGFPLITVSRNQKTLTFSQKRFMRDNSAKNERYSVPINVAIDSDDYTRVAPELIYDKADGVTKTHELTKEPAKYYILNKQQVGYYRVNYDEENWKNISAALHENNHDNIHVLNRAAIVDDLFQLARAGIVEYETAVDIIRYLKNETSYTPWLSAINHGLTFLSQRVADKDKDTFSWFIRDLMQNIYKHLTFEAKSGEKRTDIYNRVNIMTWACRYGHEECIQKSKEAFAKFLATPANKIHKDSRSFVYCNGVRHGGEAEFNLLHTRFLVEDVAAEQLNLLIGMACTKNEVSIKKYLDMIITTENVRRQDLGAAINNMLNSNNEGPDYLFKYITQNHAAWKAKMGNLGTLTTVLGRFTSTKQFDDFEAFLSTKKTELGDSHDGLKSDHEKAKKNLDWDNVHMKKFIEHLNHLKNSAPAKIISITISIISLAVLYLLN